MFTANGTCFAAAGTSLCDGNGEVELQFGSPEYIGLGALVFLLLVLLETFGSPFMRNCEVSYSAAVGNVNRVTKTVILLQSVKHAGTSFYSNTAASLEVFLWSCDVCDGHSQDSNCMQRAA